MVKMSTIDKKLLTADICVNYGPVLNRLRCLNFREHEEFKWIHFPKMYDITLI
jgi:hypothetical protein